MSLHWFRFIHLFPLLLLGDVSSRKIGEKRQQKCRNPMDQLWNSVMNGECGMPVCARIARETSWWKCPNPETEDGLYKLYERIRLDNDANLAALRNQNIKMKKLQELVRKLGSLLKKESKNKEELVISKVKDNPARYVTVPNINKNKKELEISKVKDISTKDSKTTPKRFKFNHNKLISSSASTPKPTSEDEDTDSETTPIEPTSEKSTLEEKKENIDQETTVTTPTKETFKTPVRSPSPTPDETCEGGWPTKHTMSLYDGPSETCDNRTLLRGFDKSGITIIVDKHNELREKVASGTETNGDMPAASDMMKMSWNKNLAAVAQRWSDQCRFGHDDDRSKCDGTFVGQNLFSSWHSQSSGRKEIMENSVKAVESWYEELVDPGFIKSDISPFVFSSGTGHYTQLVWAESSEIGCGLTQFEDKRWFATFIVCNYAKGGNLAGGNMYTIGEPCSNCPVGTTCDVDFPSLCS